jgi:hypothetical protein
LKETQRVIRFQDSVSLALMVVDTLLLAILVYGFAGGTLFQMISDLVDRDERWYAALILASFAVIAIVLVAHIALIIRALWPVRDAGAHVAVGDDVDIRLVNLNRLDSYRRMAPSVQAYWAKLDTMDEADIAREYIYELQ